MINYIKCTKIYFICIYTMYIYTFYQIIFVIKHLHISKKSCTFAADFGKDPKKLEIINIHKR